jgi:hypothetical protein
VHQPVLSHGLESDKTYKQIVINLMSLIIKITCIKLCFSLCSFSNMIGIIDTMQSLL